jgi:DNA polymerase-3 subunit delta
MLGTVPPPPAVTLVTGAEELLADRQVRRVIDEAKRDDPTAEVHDIEPPALLPGTLLALTSPTMFGGRTVVVLRDVQDLAEDVRDEVLAYAVRPEADVTLVAVHAGGVKGKRLVDGLTASGADVHKVPALTKPAERLEFIGAEARRLGRELRPGAAKMLLDAVGNDLRDLAAAVTQLCADNPGQRPLDEDVVSRSYRGRAETTGFQISDAAMAGDQAGAFALLRQAWEVDPGKGPVWVAAFATALRDVTAVRGTEGSSGAIAKTLGMPPWKVDKAQRTARAWSDRGLAESLVAVAEADEGVKGAAADGAWAVERALHRILAARGRR